jgi:hypothetical protein
LSEHLGQKYLEGHYNVLTNFGQNIDAKNIRMELTMLWPLLVRTSKVTPKIVRLEERTNDVVIKMGQNSGEPDLDALILKIG